MVQAQPRLKGPPTLQLEHQTLPQDSQCCFALEKTLRAKDSQASGQDLQIYQNIKVPTTIYTPHAEIVTAPPF